MLDVIFAQVRGKLKEFQKDATARRRVSQHDVGADTLDYCAAEVEKVIAELQSGSAWLTVEAYAQLKLVSPQTIRNWIRRGDLDAESTARGYMIKRGAERRRTIRRVRSLPRAG